MDRRRAWVMNLDAEDELSRATETTPSRATQARMAALRDSVGGLLLDGDVLLPNDGRSLLPSGVYVGRAWCPTPRALRVLRAAGATVPESPSREVLRAANHRLFCVAMGQTLPGATWVTTFDDAVAVVRARGETGTWLLKRPLGYAGRGRLRVLAGELDEPTRTWVRASLRGGDGLQIEPWVARVSDHALHGWLTREGEATLGEVTTQVVDERGAWRATRLLARAELTLAERDALFCAASETALALYTLGYWGPFGLDAFRWRDASGVPWWNPRCEVNARYTMGWATGMGALRPDR